MICIGHFCIGTDQTNLDFAAASGIPVFNSPFANIGLEVSRKIARFINEGYTIGSVNFPNVDLPSTATERHRIINIHRNVPGVLKQINDIVSDFNVRSQILSTTDDVVYLIIELDADKELSKEIKERMDKMDTTIKSRIMWMGS